MEPENIKDEKNDSFVNTPFFESIIERSKHYIYAGLPVHFVGPSGVGKTSLAMYIARTFNKPVTVIRGHHEMSNKDLLGQQLGYYKKEIIDNYIHSVYKKEEEARPYWQSGELVKAVMNGHTVVYDEFTRSRPETNNLFLSLLEEKILPIYGNGKESFIKCNPNFSIIFTSNPDEYAGTFHTQDALMDRLITINLEPCDESTEIEIIAKKTGLEKKEAANLVRILSKLRSLGSEFSPSLRSSIMIASICKQFSIPVNHKDKKFQDLCLDVLSRPMKQKFPDLTYSAAQQKILKEMYKKEEST